MLVYNLQDIITLKCLPMVWNYDLLLANAEKMELSCGLHSRVLRILKMQLGLIKMGEGVIEISQRGIFTESILGVSGVPKI